MHFDVHRHDDPPGCLVHAVVKVPNGWNGPRAVANELLAAELAFRLGLPCAEPLLVEIPPAIERVKLRCSPNYLTPGLAFALPYIPSEAPLGERHVRGADNLAALPGIFAFDTWVLNRDRTTPGNLLAQPARGDGGWHIWMIDHEYTFGGVGWTAASLNAEGRSPAHPCLDVVEPVLRLRATLARWVAAIQRVSAGLLASAIALVPQAWLRDAAERQAILSFLLARRDHLRALVDDYLASSDAVSTDLWVPQRDHATDLAWAPAASSALLPLSSG